MLPEQALGKRPILGQSLLLFQYAVYPVDGCTLFLDTVSVFGIVLHYLSCTYLAIYVYLPKDN